MARPEKHPILLFDDSLSEDEADLWFSSMSEDERAQYIAISQSYRDQLDDYTNKISA